MTESTIEIQTKSTNPDGREHPVFFDQVTKTHKGIQNRRLRIVASNNQRFDYKAIDPQTGREISLGATQWISVYALLDKEPPNDLAERVRQYYEIKKRQDREKARKSNPIYSPHEDP